jgi:indole-3-glycerol phosphate synthase
MMDTHNSSDFLSRILAQKRRELEAAQQRLPERQLRDLAEKAQKRRSLVQRMIVPGRQGVNIIAEIKRASPSKGIIRPDLDVEAYATAYERGGAAAISILTDREHFRGDPEDLLRVRKKTQLPLLRKDFLIAPYQLYESVVLGADAVLLIVRAISEELLADCLSLCRVLQLDALVEVHSEAELEQATRAGALLIGINNRDLRTFKTDLQTSVRISRHLAIGQVAVAESGISERRDLELLLAAGIWNFLIGESLVRAADPEQFLKTLMGNPQV